MRCKNVSAVILACFLLYFFIIFFYYIFLLYFFTNKMFLKIFSWYYNELYGITCYRKNIQNYDLKIVNRRVACKQINHSW